MNTESLRGMVEEYDGRFRSSNSIPVDRIWLTKDMWEQMRESLLNQAPVAPVAANPEVDRFELLEIARQTGLRAQMYGVAPAHARELLSRFVAAVDDARNPAAPVAYPSEDHGCVYENGDGVCRECADLAAAIKASAPAAEVDEAMVDRALAVMFPGKYDEHLRKNWRETTRNALAAALGQEKG